MNFQAVGAIYTFEMARFFRTLKQSFLVSCFVYNACILLCLELQLAVGWKLLMGSNTGHLSCLGS